MQRTVLATAVGVLLLTTSACDGTPSGDPAATAPSATSATATAATTSAPAETAPSPEADHAADTRKVCRQVDKLLGGKGMGRFAEELGKLVIYQKADQGAKAKQAREAAKQELKNVAAAVRRTTSPARDPKVKAAGERTAASIEKSAADEAFFARLRTIKDVARNLEPEMTPWLTPLATFCV